MDRLELRAGLAICGAAAVVTLAACGGGGGDLSVTRPAVVAAANPAVPALQDYYATVPPLVIDSTYFPSSMFSPVTADIDGDGIQDLIVLGADYPGAGATTYSPQPGRVFRGDGNFGFTPLPQTVFPVDSLNTVHPRKVLFADFNGDGRTDMFISSHGWDAAPFPGEQNRLYLSQPDGTWRDSTAALPQLSDFSHSSAAGDIDGDGKIDLFVGNGYAASDGLAYTLMNGGNGQFTMNRANVPVGAGQSLDTMTAHNFPGATLVDLDGDGLPELIVTGDASAAFDAHPRTAVYWNHHGSYSDADVTLLPASASFPASHIDIDVQAVDVNGDGLLDLIVVGTQGQPFYDGWFVQVLINHGDRQFIDETASRVPPGAMTGGAPGTATGTPWAMWVKIVDFNGDGKPDLAVEYNGGTVTSGMPLIWLNDGTGHFTTLKAGDFVPAGSEWMLAGAHIMPTANGYSFISTQSGAGGLVVTGLRATRRYTAVPSATNQPAAVAQCLFDWAERNYAGFLQGASPAVQAGEYFYRYYAQSHAYLGLSGRDNHLYYLGPAFNNLITDLGPAGDWIARAGCQ